MTEKNNERSNYDDDTHKFIAKLKKKHGNGSWISLNTLLDKILLLNFFQKKKKKKKKMSSIREYVLKLKFLKG